MTVQVLLPVHLSRIAQTGSKVELEMEGPVTLGTVLDALEARYPMLRGNIRDHVTKERRPFLRYFACGEDWSHEPQEIPLPGAIVEGKEPLRIVGAMSGG